MLLTASTRNSPALKTGMITETNDCLVSFISLFVLIALASKQSQVRSLPFLTARTYWLARTQYCFNLSSFRIKNPAELGEYCVTHIHESSCLDFSVPDMEQVYR